MKPSQSLAAKADSASTPPTASTTASSNSAPTSDTADLASLTPGAVRARIYRLEQLLPCIAKTVARGESGAANREDMRSGADRILAKTIIDQDGCWIWLGTHNRKGYPMLYIAGRYVYAHRVTYEATVAAIPDGMELDHLCHNRGCLNPAHLKAVTHVDHLRRHGKLNELGVTEIRISTEGASALARRFGVTEGAIRHVREGRTWEGA